MRQGRTNPVIGGITAAACLLFANGANAQNVTYHVDRAFGGGYDNNYGHISGTIETDGALGPLDAGNIVSWSFEAFDGTDVVSISSATGFLQGEAWNYLSASDTELTFDFDGALGSGLAQSYISFHGGDANNSIDYNLLGNFVGKVEQIVHQFGTPPANGEHRVDSVERSVETIGWVNRPSSDCSAPAVSLGEAMAGFQSGFTAGSHTATGPAGDYMLGVFGEDRRGFIVPESIDESQQCENDYLVVSGFIGARIKTASGDTVRTPKEAIDLVASGYDGLFVGKRIEIDGVLVEHMNTAPKIGAFPNGTTFAVISSGIIIEPYLLSQGWHLAEVIYELDFDRDGNPDSEWPFAASFKINPAE